VLKLKVYLYSFLFTLNQKKMFEKSHYQSKLPKWKFWARMNRQFVDDKANPAGSLKMSMIKTVDLLDAEGKAVIKAKVKLGAASELFSTEGVSIGDIKKISQEGSAIGNLLKGKGKLWGVEHDGKAYLSLVARKKTDVADITKDFENVSLADADDIVYQCYKGNTLLATMISGSSLMDETHDFIFEKDTSEADRALCLALFGYKLHALI
jgi:hypothetical protein